VFIIPSFGQFYIENVIVGLYLGLFIVAFFLSLLKIKPFTINISKKDYPEVIVKSKMFLKINLIINYIWAGLFAIAILLTVIKYSDNTIVQTVLSMITPIIAQLTLGVLATKKIPLFLMGKGATGMHFESTKDLFKAMPYGLNKELAQDVNAIIQFYLTGEEPTEGFLIINDLKCKFEYGSHPNPKTTVKSDSKLWLDISNGDISGSKAFINKEYEVEGDSTILLKLNALFAPTKKEKKSPELKKIEFGYKKTFEPGKIKKIVVFDGGPRTNKYSKTSLIVNSFIEGAKDAGANIEYFKLNKFDIHDCSGCYNCWTKTPGECIYKDDMTMLRKKYREADLVVFATPLYIFNVTGIFKRFMDRLLPVLKPYMLIDERGFTTHPDRYPEFGEQGFVVFSAAGFPDLEHNFDGLIGMFKMWAAHSENMYIMGEFYLTAAETIVQPVYRDRKIAVQNACKKAGGQIVNEGKIDVELMQKVTEHGYTPEQFQEESNYFWESLDGKISYLKGVPIIE